MRYLVIVITTLLFVSDFIQCSGVETTVKQRLKNRCNLIGCDYYLTRQYDDIQFQPINNLSSLISDDYKARFKLHITGPGNALISLSQEVTTSNLIGLSKYIVSISRRTRHVAISKEESTKEYVLNSREISATKLPNQAVQEVLIEVTETGYINVYLDNDTEPTISAYDFHPIDVKNVSFSSDQVAAFYYNCPLDKNVIPSNESNKNVSTEEDTDLSMVPIHVLASKCKVEEGIGDEFNRRVKIGAIEGSQPEGYRVSFAFYMLNYAKVRFSSYEYYSAGEHYILEIDRDNKSASLHEFKSYVNYKLPDVKLPKSDRNKKQVRIFVQISRNGVAEVFFGNVHRPIISQRVSSISVQYIEFASKHSQRSAYFYGCDENAINLTAHSLLTTDLRSQYDLSYTCAVYHSSYNAFPEYWNISSVGNIHSDGYIVQLPIYIGGAKDAFILLTTDIASKNKNFYEFEIGGVNNTIVAIRKNNQVLARVEEEEILEDYGVVQFVLEISKSGQIRIFNHYNRIRPLLEFKDETPITNLKYISFTGHYEQIEFYFNCGNETTSQGRRYWNNF